MIEPTPATAGRETLRWPLMMNNISRADLDAVIEFLRRDDPILTQSEQVRAFEQEWSRWIGVRHSVFVNSGSSANLVTMAALRATRGPGEVIVPALTWVSDIAALLHCGFTPVFVDIDLRTLGMRTDQAIAKITPRTKAVFLTHALGYNALDRALLEALENRGVPLIEDVCESYGATFQGRRLGSFGLMSNFSFYYAHHLSTIEGGMVSTDDPDLHEMARMLRAHGLVREASSEALRRSYAENHPDLNPEFIFAVPGYNVRSTEIQAVIGRSQLRRLDDSNRRRVENFALFLENIDPSRYRTDFATEGSCNYAFTLILRQPDDALFRALTDGLRRHGIEFRRGTAGGGNQLRQPYVRDILGPIDLGGFPNVEHVHRYGAYIGNYPGLEKKRILELCAMLNDLQVR